ncbi:restriction endonuclease subunit S [Halobacteria archaeon AArc-dxtr1]|nr:restriction endonuclease subunit S [Halobacteria archaeon AArc-dxtr1]
MSEQFDLSEFDGNSGQEKDHKRLKEDWEKKTFSDIIQINNYPSLEKGVEQTHVGMRQLGENVRKVQATTKKEYKYSKPRFQNGDTLFARITPCLENGKTAYVDLLEDGEAATGSTEFLVMSSTEATIPKFVYYTARRPTIRQFAIKRMTGSSGRQRVPTDIFDNIEIQVPPKAEQERIVDVLDSFDSKIECNNKMSELLHETCDTIFNNEFEGAVEYIRGNRDELEDYEIEKLGEITENYDSERVPLSQAERDERPGKHPYYGATGPLDQIDDFKFDGKYILVAEDGHSVKTDKGYPYIQFLNKKFWPSNHAHVLQGKGTVSTEYIRWALSKIKIDPYITGSAQPKLSQRNLNSIEIPVPSKKRLNEFTETVRPMHKQIWHNERENDSLADLRDMLLPKLMTGEIRLDA